MAEYNVLRFKIGQEIYAIPISSGIQNGLISSENHVKLQGVEDYAEQNLIEKIKINGMALAIASKAIDLSINAGASDGTISVAGQEIAVKGLAALAYKSSVSVEDIDAAFSILLNQKAESSDVSRLQQILDVLNGSGEGSVRKTVADAINDFATRISDDGIVNSYKELIDWVAQHGADAAVFASDLSRIEKILNGIGGNDQPTTVVSAIQNAIDALNISNFYTKAEIESKLSTKVDKVNGKGLSTNDFTDLLKQKLEGVEQQANKYILPIASSSKLGGIMIGDNLLISADGRLSANAPYTHPLYGSEIRVENATGQVLSGITVNNAGHTIGVVAKTLLEEDIPSLSIAKITGLQTALNGKAASTHTHSFEALTGKPTTLQGYGITDAATSTHTHSQYLTDHQSVVNKGATLSWGAASTIATVGSTDIKVSLPANPNTDTKNTAGSTQSTSKLYLIGATGQSANPQTYSNSGCYIGTDGCLYSGGTKVLTGHQSLSAYLTSEAAASTYLTKTDASSTYQPKGNYLTAHQSLADYLKKADASTTYALKSHTHAISEITGLQSALDGKAATSHSHSYIASSGNKTMISGETLGDSGVRLFQVYNNGYPCLYGNLLNVGGIGYGEVLFEWSGNTTPKTGDIYYRSKRDQKSTEWSSWVKLLTSDNFSSYAAAKEHTHSQYLTAHQSLADYLKKTDASSTYAPLSHTHTIANVTGLQSALDGKSTTSHSHTFASLTSKPTTLSGYGITDAYNKTDTENGFVRATKMSNGLDVTDITTNRLWISGTDAESQALKNSPFTQSFALLSANNYISGEDYRRPMFAFDGRGNAKLFNDRDTNGKAGAWYSVLTSANWSSYCAAASHTHSQYLTGHQTIRTLTLQKNGTNVATFNPIGTANTTINLSDVASAATLSSHTGNTTAHITAAERIAWNKVVTDFTAITGTDSDTVINKWEEVLAFLNNYTEADTLAGLLNNKADKTSLSSAVDRITALEGKNYLSGLSLSTTGSGNAITALALSSDKKVLTATKGTSFMPYSSQNVAYTNQTGLIWQGINIENENLISGYSNYFSVLNLGSYSGSNFRSQLAFPYQSDQTDTNAFIRTANGTNWRPWRRLLHDNNWSAYCAAKEHTHSQYLTSHQSLANYVTLNSAQTISGVKTFANNIVFRSIGSSDTYPEDSKGLSWSGGTDGAYVRYRLTGADKGKLILGMTDDHDTEINFEWTGGVMASNAGVKYRFCETALIAEGVTATFAAIKKSNGTASQFLKADGSVDSNAYALSNHTHTFASLTSKPTTLSGYGITDAAASNHTHSQYLTAHQSLANYVTLNSAQTISGVKTFENGIRFSPVDSTDSAPRIFSEVEGARTSLVFDISDDNDDGFVFRSRRYGLPEDSNVNIFNITYGSIRSLVKITAESFIKSNGTASQFLKADGSVDSNTYLTAITKAQVEAVLTGNVGSHTHSTLTSLSPEQDLNEVNGIGFISNDMNAKATSERHYPIQEAGSLIYCNAAYGSANQIYGSYNSNRWFARGGNNSNANKTAWKEFAFLSSNVATATALQTSRTLWGQSFNGTGNVSGNMTGVGNINTAASPIGTIYANNWFRSTGSTGWYSETYKGGWYMTDNDWMRVFNNKGIYTNGQIYSGTSIKIGGCTLTYDTNAQTLKSDKEIDSVKALTARVAQLEEDLAKVKANSGKWCNESLWAN